MAASQADPIQMAHEAGVDESALLDMIWSSPQALYLIVEGRYRFCNPQGAALLGYEDLHKIIDLDIYQTIDPKYHETIVERLRSLAIGESNPPIRMELILQSGERLLVETQSTAILFHGERATLVTGRNMTEQARLETMLGAANQEKELILNATSQRMAYYTPDMTLCWANKAYLQELGRSKEEVEGKACYQLWYDKTEPCSFCPIRQTSQTGEPQEAFVETKNQQIWFLRSYPVRNHQGDLVGILEIGENRTEQVNTERKLEENRERLKISLEGSHDGLWDWPDLKKPIFWWSPRYYEMLGYRPDEFVPTQERFLSIVHPDDRAAQSQRVQEDMKSHEPFQFEFRVLTRNGETRWIHSKGRVFVGEDGQPNRMAGSVRDVTDRKLAESALRESENRFRIFAEKSQDTIYILKVQPSPKWIYLSPSVFSLTGYRPEEFYRNPSLGFEVLGDENFSKILMMLQSDLESTRSIRILCGQKHGGFVWTEHRFSLVRNDQGNILLVQGIARNITDQVHSEEEIGRLNEVLNLQNKVATIFLTKGESETYADVLDVILKTFESEFGLFGYMDEHGDLVCPSMTRHIWSKCEMPDKSIVFPKEIWGGLWGESLEKKQTIWKNETLSLPMGHVQLKNALAVAVVHQEKLVGQIIVANRKGGYNVLLADRLERVADQVAPILFAQLEKRKAEAEQRSLKSQLIHAQKMEAIGCLAGGIAHDFNNILTGITGNVSMMLLDTLEQDPFYEPLMEIDKAGARAASLVKQLLAFSRKQLIEPRVLDLNQLLRSIKKMLGRIIGENIILNMEIDGEIPAIKADPNQLEQVIVNLAVNARDAMPTGGTLSLKTDHCMVDPEDAIIKGVQAGGYVVLNVKDTGCGMDASVMEHLFEPFFTTKTADQGTGLGLATSFGVIQQHRGTITVESSPMIGTTFQVFLPSVREKATMSDLNSGSKEMQSGKETILFVEDEPIVRDVATKILSRLGYTLLAAPSGDEALYLFERQSGKIDLLLTDVILTDMDGRQLATKLIQHKPDLRVLYTSGYSKNILAAQGELPEGIAFLAKPYTPQTLSRKVREVLDSE